MLGLAVDVIDVSLKLEVVVRRCDYAGGEGHRGHR